MDTFLGEINITIILQRNIKHLYHFITSDSRFRILLGKF